MGVFLNSIKRTNIFEEVSRSENFLDNSKIIEKTNEQIRTSEKYICITRPRRYGKTNNAIMLASYYTKNLYTKDIFDKLEISKSSSYLEHLNKHNVVFISLNARIDEIKDYEEYIKYFRDGIKKDLKEAYPYVPDDMYLVDMLEYIHKRTREGFIFIIDEWDCLFERGLFTEDNRKNFVSFIEGLLKDKAYIELVYMTGILPVSQRLKDSPLNMFIEYTNLNDTKYKEYFRNLSYESQY